MTRRWSSLLLAGALALSSLAGCVTERRGEGPAKLPEPQRPNVQAARERALAAQKIKDPERAITLYQESVSLNPEFSVAWNNLGVLLMSLQRYLEASEAFARATELEPTDPRPMYNLALTWDRAGYPDEALRFYIRTIDRDPNYLPALRGAVRAQQLRGEADERTLEWIRRALLQETDRQWRVYLTSQRAVTEQAIYREGKGISRGDPLPSRFQPPPRLEALGALDPR